MAAAGQAAIAGTGSVPTILHPTPMKTTEHPLTGNQYAAKAPGGLPARINFACSDELKNAAETAAKECDMTPADFYRAAIQEKITAHQSG